MTDKTKIAKDMMDGFEESCTTTDNHFVTLLPYPEKIDTVESCPEGTGLKIYSKISDKDIYFSACMAINLFREESNNAAGLAALVFFLKAGLYPPEDLLEWLSDGFSDWILNDGKTGIGKILKLEKQNTPSLKKVTLLERDIKIAGELRMLIYTFGYTQEKTAEMIALRMEQEKDPLAISAETILREIFPFKKRRETKHGYFFYDFNEKEKKEILDRYKPKRED